MLVITRRLTAPIDLHSRLRLCDYYGSQWVGYRTVSCLVIKKKFKSFLCVFNRRKEISLEQHGVEIMTFLKKCFAVNYPFKETQRISHARCSRA